MQRLGYILYPKHCAQQTGSVNPIDLTTQCNNQTSLVEQDAQSKGCARYKHTVWI